MTPNCEEADTFAPRVGCGCRQCYRAREVSLDPRLIEIARRPPMTSIASMSFGAQEIVYRALQEYLIGRMDYGALHLSIIKSLIDRVDRQHEMLTSIVAARPLAYLVKKEELK